MIRISESYDRFDNGMPPITTRLAIVDLRAFIEEQSLPGETAGNQAIESVFLDRR